ILGLLRQKIRVNLRSSAVALSIGLCFLGLVASGCTESQRGTIMGNGFNDEFSKGNQNLRPKGDGNYDGVSTKSQQIEHDLGV
ncbi:MAG TPA: hypothetical protein VG056_11345, partial [Pirellulales bacterium]|nr:hypothetical protein [Pirellulales bacterium]